MPPDSRPTAQVPALVLVVEDDPFVSDMLFDALEAYGFACHTYANAEALLGGAIPAEAGCVISDIRMPGIGGIALQHELAQREPQLPVLLMSGHGDIAMAVQAMKDGAFDFVEKPFSPAALIQRVRAAIAEGAARRARLTQQADLATTFDRLSEREHEVLRGMSEGKVTKEIAQDLHLSVRTVEHHRERIIAKLDVNGVNDLLYLYARWRLAREDTNQAPSEH